MVISMCMRHLGHGESGTLSTKASTYINYHNNIILHYIDVGSQQVGAQSLFFLLWKVLREVSLTSAVRYIYIQHNFALKSVGVGTWLE